MIVHGVAWSGYEAQVAWLGDAPVPRVAYLDGAMELMSPSWDHERLKSYLGRLIETYALERGIELSPYGSWTLRNAPRAAGVEPDECYVIAAASVQRVERPDLAIEVVWTSGGIDKLEIYRRLEVPEVWFWREGALDVYALRDGGYQKVDRHRPERARDFSRVSDGDSGHPRLPQGVGRLTAVARGGKHPVP